MIALSYLDLLNLFEFDADVYVVFFLLMCFVVVMGGVSIYLCFRCATRLPYVPPLRFFDLLYVMSPAPIYGVLIAYVPFALALAFTWVWFFELRGAEPFEEPQAINFEGVPENWASRGVIQEEDLLRLLRGRYGTAL